MSEGLRSVDPRSGAVTDTGLAPSTPADVDDAVIAAAQAHAEISSHGRTWRARLLDALADALAAHAEILAETAESETALGLDRLRGEIGRSVFQFRLFAEAVRDGGYLEAAVDHATTNALGRVPDVRSMLVPLPVVAVFGSSNFPFAFSTAGGDVASALAAGSAVVVKAHGSHLLTTQRTLRVLQEALQVAGAPPGLIGAVWGTRAGIDLVRHPAVAAVGFTGSTSTAAILRAAISERDVPIPFFGELSSLNPLVVTPNAAAERAEEIGGDLLASFTLGSGQFCTKPGLAFVPEGEGGDRLVASLLAAAATTPPMVLLNERIRDSFDQVGQQLGTVDGVETLTTPVDEDAPGFAVRAAVLSVKASRWSPAVAEERFGPSIVLVRYQTIEQALAVLGSLPGSLTASIQYAEGDETVVSAFVREAQPRAGRLVFNGYPTGVRVSWAQHHGGPWPATNTQFTSVGVASIRRFLRPIAFQGAPEWALPLELREPWVVPGRIDGVLT